jgi:hypothetical protein
MVGHTDFQPILNANHSIEAIFRLSRDGLPLHGLTRVDRQVDEVVSIAAGLFSSALELGLARDDDHARLFIGAAHGSLFVRAEKGQTLLLVLTTGQSTERQIEAMIDDYGNN